MNSIGEVYAAWIGAPRVDGGSNQVFFTQRLAGQWQAPFPIGDVNWAASSTGQESPAIAFDANDVFYVIWRGLNSKADRRIFARALVSRNSRLAGEVVGWSRIISLDDPECSDVW